MIPDKLLQDMHPLNNYDAKTEEETIEGTLLLHAGLLRPISGETWPRISRTTRASGFEEGNIVMTANT
jgi:hypothetical protein